MEKLCYPTPTEFWLLIQISPEQLVARLCSLLELTNPDRSPNLKQLLDILDSVWLAGICQAEVQQQLALHVNSCLAMSEILVAIKISIWASAQ